MTDDAVPAAPTTPAEIRAAMNATFDRLRQADADLGTLRRELGGVTGAARAGVDVAQSGTAHTARQIVYALAKGAAYDPDLAALLVELATESERLSGEAVRLHSLLLEHERPAKAASAAEDIEGMARAVDHLSAVHADGMALHSEAVELRRRLPREYGDPLNLDTSWPTT